jgi:hypothetical protein
MISTNNRYVPRWWRLLVRATVVATIALSASAVIAGGAATAATPVVAVSTVSAVVPAAAIDSCATVAYKAGFSYTANVSTSQGDVRQIVVAVAVAMAESSCNPNAVFTNPGGCRDRGLWQIDDCAHPSVNDTCAFQVQCNADAAWTISDHGTDWGPWSTFSNGAWVSHLTAARAAVSGFTVTLENQANGTCLDASKASAGNGGNVQQWTCVGSDPYQQWTVSAVDGDNPTLRNVGAGTCLDASKANTGDGGVIQQWTCSSGDTNQRWWVMGSGDLHTDGDADASLKSSGEATCLDASNANAGNGGVIQQWGCAAGDSDQDWN